MLWLLLLRIYEFSADFLRIFEFSADFWVFCGFMSCEDCPPPLERLGLLGRGFKGGFCCCCFCVLSAYFLRTSCAPIWPTICQIGSIRTYAGSTYGPVGPRPRAPGPAPRGGPAPGRCFPIKERKKFGEKKGKKGKGRKRRGKREREGERNCF